MRECVCVCGTYDARLEGRLHLPLLERLPVDLLVEERVDEDGALHAVRLDAAQALRRVLRHELKGQGHHDITHPAGIEPGSHAPMYDAQRSAGSGDGTRNTRCTCA